jgi:hypothetical protein
MRLLFAVAASVFALARYACAEPLDTKLAPAPDYAQPADWICRPGAEDLCVKELSALQLDAHGRKTPLPPFAEAKDPPIDCFYIYPTVSREPSVYSDLKIDADVIRAAHGQAGRFASVCKVYAPVYRQFTLTALLAPDRDTSKDIPSDASYQDVVAAWRYYLAHDNHGRGVVLIGHSQGTFLLQRLLKQEIDGKPDQKLLVSALLGGDLAFNVAPGKDVGGTLKAIPLCRAQGQTGCVITWATYQVDDKISPIVFGRSRPGAEAACTNPAALAGGRAMLHPYFHKLPEAPAEDPPYVAFEGQYSAECVKDEGGATLRVTVEPGAFQAILKGLLDKTASRPGWGLHILDYSLPQGDLVADVDAQAQAWAKTHPGS